MTQSNLDGKPDEVKVSCPVLSGGKSRDNIKGLPIAITLERRAHGLLLRDRLENAAEEILRPECFDTERQRPFGKPGNREHL